MLKKTGFTLLAAIALAALSASSSAQVTPTGCSVRSTIAVDSSPNNIIVNPVTNKIYTKSFDNPSVSVIDGATDTLVATIPVSDVSGTVSVNTLTNRIYAASGSSGAGFVDVIDGSTDTVVATINVGGEAFASSSNESTNLVYVTLFSSGQVAVIDGATNSLITTVSVGAGPTGLDVDPAANRIFVANSIDGTVSVIDGSIPSVVSTISIGGDPLGVIFDPIGGPFGFPVFFVVDNSSALITVLDTNELFSYVLTPSVPVFALEGSLDVLTGMAGRLYLSPTNVGDARAIVFDVFSEAELGSTTVSSGSGQVVPNPGTGLQYFASFPNSTVEVIDCGSPPTFDSGPCGQTLMASVGVPVSYTVTASDVDMGDTLTLSAPIVPTGATHTPALPTSGNPVSATFDWTPNNPNVGTVTVFYRASDGVSVTRDATCTVRIMVAECHLLLSAGRGSGTFEAGGYVFDTKLDDVLVSYPVLVNDIPIFPVEAVFTSNGVVDLQDLAGNSSTGGAFGFGRPFPVAKIFSQVVMYNPDIYPSNVEQSTHGLKVTLWSNGNLSARRFGQSDGAMEMWLETFVLSGKTYFRLPFSVGPPG